MVARRGAGGLVTGLGLARGRQRRDLDRGRDLRRRPRRRPRRGAIEAEGFRVRLLDIDPAVYRPGLRRGLQRDPVVRPPRPVRPRPGGRASTPAGSEAWAAYRAVNEALRRRRRRGSARRRGRARAGLPPRPARLRSCADERPDLRRCTSATPRSPCPTCCGCCPTDAAAELLDGMAAHDACGFHTRAMGRRRSSTACARASVASPTDVRRSARRRPRRPRAPRAGVRRAPPRSQAARRDASAIGS